MTSSYVLGVGKNKLMKLKRSILANEVWYKYLRKLELLKWKIDALLS